MSNSKYEYVKSYEADDRLLPQTYIVIRVDGRKFHQFSKCYRFNKPNDMLALSLMNKAAEGVIRDLQDIFLAYGSSDEYSFVFLKDTTLFDRRSAKLVSTVTSIFTAHYVCQWSTQFPSQPLVPEHLPSFDGRAVVYPNLPVLRDYFCWRQVDCHINNLYNTTFWALVSQGGLSPDEAESRLCGTVAADKNEILFSEFDINYNNEPSIYRKGTVLKRTKQVGPSQTEQNLSKRQMNRKRKALGKVPIEVIHDDIIRNEELWTEIAVLNGELSPQ